MSDCEYCDLIAKSQFKLYEDDKAVALLAPRPSVPGHILILPAKHYAVLGAIPDYLVSHLFVVANKISVAIFASMKVQGTNILVQNGTPAGQTIAHIALHLLPRLENDGISFSWRPRSIGEEAMSTIELKLKEASRKISLFEKESNEPLVIDKQEEKIAATKEKNYMISQLDRMP